MQDTIILSRWHRVRAELCALRAMAELQDLKARGYRIRDYTIDPAKEFEYKRDGVIAEIACSILLDRQWSGFQLSNRKAGDLAGGIEVRSIRRRNGALQIRRRDDPSRIYVGVEVWDFPRCRIAGWLYGKEALRPEWEYQRGHQISSVYLAPQRFLRPAEHLLARRFVDIDSTEDVSEEISECEWDRGVYRSDME